MNLWIFISTLMFHPVTALGLVEPEPAMENPPIVTADEDFELELEEPMRYRGIERLLAEMEARALVQ